MLKDWRVIKTEEDFHNILEKSKYRTQIVFKDSIHCGISAFAKERLTNGYDLLTDKADFNYLDLLSYRSISNLIAKELEVTHQSPQVIIIRAGNAIHTVTHSAIDPEKIANHL